MSSDTWLVLRLLTQAGCLQEGGSWEVRVSLAAVGQWIRSLRRLDPVTAFRDGLLLPPRSMEDPEVARYTSQVSEVKTPQGAERRSMRAVKHSAVLSATPAREEEAPMRLDAHLPEWLARE